MRYRIVMELPDFHLEDHNYTERELRLEFLRTLKNDLEEIEDYLDCPEIKIRFEKISE